jgi:N utilization substance protein A
MDITAESRRAVSELFGDADEEISRISELPGIDPNLAQAFLNNNIDFIEDFLSLESNQLESLEGISQEQLETLRKLIDEYVEIVEEESSEEYDEHAETQSDSDSGEENESAEDEEYECPECGAKITIGMTNCPSCNIGLSFEYEED